jgi:hypothetical protein
MERKMEHENETEPEVHDALIVKDTSIIKDDLIKDASIIKDALLIHDAESLLNNSKKRELEYQEHRKRSDEYDRKRQEEKIELKNKKIEEKFNEILSDPNLVIPNYIYFNVDIGIGIDNWDIQNELQNIHKIATDSMHRFFNDSEKLMELKYEYRYEYFSNSGDRLSRPYTKGLTVTIDFKKVKDVKDVKDKCCIC